MDETDAWLFAVGLASMAVGLLLLSQAIREIREDVALLRITAAVPEIERHG